MRKYLYLRTSCDSQSISRQLPLIEKYGLRKSDTFIDKATGKNFERPQYQALKSEIQTGDTLIIKSIDRLGRNKQQSLNELREFKEKGVRIIVDDIPTTQIEVDEKNKLMLDMINNILIEVYTTLAEEELNRTKERQIEGYKSLEKDNKGRLISKKTNKVVGRTNKQENLTKEQERYIKAWLNKSIKLADCIKFTNLSRATLYRIKENKKDWV
ncbi:MAG: recombinase family protein [Cetobacterium sp.]|uniref:recombinase family protein n=1 Tax=Cetobacterium sp. TaxID=2071632 RepID=UPI002FCC3476